jgi:O-antigen ligase
MFKENPLLGVGANNFNASIIQIFKENNISESVTPFSHAHNEYICSLATGGIFGFISTTLMFILPIIYFFKHYYITAWARQGFWTTILFAFFSLTDCMFDRRIMVIMFSAIISTCISGILHKTKPI